MESVVISVETANEENMAKYAIQRQARCASTWSVLQGWRAGDFIFVTGTGPIDPSTGNLVGNTIEQQTEETIDNISAILEADGASLLDVVKVTVHLSDTSHFARYNSYMLSAFRSPIQCAPRLAAIWGTPRDANRNHCIAYNTEKTSRGNRALQRAGSTSKKVAFRTLLMRSFFRARP